MPIRNKSKLFTYLASMETDELERFALFLQAPTIKLGKDTYRFFQLIIPTHPEYANDDQTLHHQIYPDKEFKDHRLRQIRSELLKHLEQFWTYQQLEDDLPTKTKLKVKAYIQRGHSKEARKLIETEVAALTSSPMGYFPQGEKWLALEELRMGLHVTEEARHGSTAHIQLLSAIDHHFLSFRLKALSAALSEQEWIDKGNSTIALRETLEMAERTGALNHPLVALYYYLVLVQTATPFHSHLAQLHTLLDQYHNHIADEELCNAFAILVNKFSRDLVLGISGSMRRLFAIYQKMEHWNLFLGMGTYTLRMTRNAISTAARLQEFDWAKAFMDQVLPQLSPDDHQQLENFGAAQIAFHQGDYSKAQKHLVLVHFPDPLVKLNAENTLLKCYFFTQETEAFTSLLESIRRYLTRHKEISSQARQGYFNFLSIVKYLYDLKWELGSRYSTTQLLLKMEEYDLFFNRDWTKEQLIKL